MGKRRRLGRRPARRDPKPRLLIVCEGMVTEKEYFEDIRIRARSVMEIAVIAGGVPKALVERAVSLKQKAEDEADAKKDDFLRYDEVWCVFDVDEHPLLPEAKRQAASNGIRLAVSNPCFELWVLLHFEDQRAHIHRREVQRRCRGHMPKYKKSLPLEELRPKHPKAVERATQLEKWHGTRGTQGENPSTRVHHLTERIIEAGGWSFERS